MASTTEAPDIYWYANFTIPEWLQVVLGITAVTAALLLITCLLLCCMRMCGCWSGNILGVGSLKRGHLDGDHIGCWCCRPHGIMSTRHDDSSYVIQGTNSGNSTPRQAVWRPHTHPIRNNNQSTQ